MSNPIADPDHELGLGAWQFVGSAVRETGSAASGAWYVRSRHETGGGAVFSRHGQQITLPDLDARTLVWSIREHDPPPAGVRITVELWDGHVPIAAPFGDQLYSRAYAGPGGAPPAWTEHDSGLVAPLSTSCTLVVVTSGNSGGISSAEWYTDLWSFLSEAESETMRKRREIRAAVAAALATITTANGHAVQVASVFVGLRRIDKVTSYPEVQVTYGVEERDHNELHRKRSTLTISMYAIAKNGATLTADEQLDELAGSIEQVLETQTVGQWLGLGYLDQVTLEEIEPYEMDSDDGRRIYRVDAAIVYRYDRTEP